MKKLLKQSTVVIVYAITEVSLILGLIALGYINEPSLFYGSPLGFLDTAFIHPGWLFLAFTGIAGLGYLILTQIKERIPVGYKVLCVVFTSLILAMGLGSYRAYMLSGVSGMQLLSGAVILSVIVLCSITELKEIK